MSIIKVFNSEKELYEEYPKNKYFKLRDIFADYWDYFLDYANTHNLTIRSVVKRDVSRMISCKTPALGSSTYICPDCNNFIHVYNTCKSRFCNSCGVKYSKQRSLAIESSLLDCNHRHLVFTISDFLWPLFL